MPPKTRWKTLLVVLGFFIAAFIAYSLFSYQRATDDMPAGPPMQMSRIDFQEEVDSLTASKIKSSVLSKQGVQHAYFNIPDHILVYSHDPRTISNEAMLASLKSEFTLSAQPYKVDAESLASSCPVTGQNSIFVQVGGFISRFF